MSAFRKRTTDDHELVARINSEHLSDQFQRELSNTPEDDLLQDRELKLDDIHSASGLHLYLVLASWHCIESVLMVTLIIDMQAAALRH